MHAGDPRRAYPWIGAHELCADATARGIRREGIDVAEHLSKAFKNGRGIKNDGFLQETALNTEKKNSSAIGRVAPALK